MVKFKRLWKQDYGWVTVLFIPVQWTGWTTMLEEKLSPLHIWTGELSHWTMKRCCFKFLVAYHTLFWIPMLTRWLRFPLWLFWASFLSVPPALCVRKVGEDIAQWRWWLAGSVYLKIAAAGRNGGWILFATKLFASSKLSREGGSNHLHCWSSAWKRVFNRRKQLNIIRQSNEVSENWKAGMLSCVLSLTSKPSSNLQMHTAEKGSWVVVEVLS